jgi:hypothetical protein
MPVKLSSTGGGSVTLTTPSTATDYTATFPANTGNVVTDSATQTLTNKTLTSPVITGASVSSMASSVITSGTSQASTSGTSIDFTGIPSWVKRITVMFNGVSTNGTSPVIVQLGTGATPTYTTSGYQSFVLYNGGTTNITNGLTTIGIGASDTRWGSMILSTSGSNSWTEIVGNAVGTNGGAGGGGITLGAALTAIRITTSNGTDAFDAGSINILYE